MRLFCAAGRHAGPQKKKMSYPYLPPPYSLAYNSFFLFFAKLRHDERARAMKKKGGKKAKTGRGLLLHYYSLEFWLPKGRDGTKCLI